MTKQKSNFNWYFLIAGVLILYFGLFNNQLTKRSELQKITVELHKDVTNVKGRKSIVDYKFWTKEYKNQFNILNGSITRGKHKSIASLKDGQKVDLFITTSDFEKLSIGKEDITVRGINLYENSLMTTDEFYYNRELYRVRLKLFSVFTAIMLILNGLANIPNKLNYIIIGTFIGTIVVMKFLKTGIY